MTPSSPSCCRPSAPRWPAGRRGCSPRAPDRTTSHGPRSCTSRPASRTRPHALLLRLARRDATRGALRTAEQHLAAAAAAAPGDATVAAERVAVLTQVGRAGAALALGAAQLDALHGDAHAEMCLQLARTAVTGGEWAEAEGYVERAGRPDDPRSLVLRADAAFGAGRAGAAGELAARAVARAEETGAPAALCEALGVVSRVAWRTDLDVTESAARRAAQVAAEHGLTPWRVRALFDLGMMQMLRADDPATLLGARDLAVDAGMLGQVAAIDFVMSDYLWYIDGPRATEALVRPLAALTRPLRLPQLQAGIDAMAEMLELGARAAAGDAAALARARQVRPVTRPDDIGPQRWQVTQVLVALLEHDLPRADAALSTGVVPLLLGKAVSPPLPLLGAWALLRAANGDGEDGRRARTAAATQVRANRGAFAYADAITAGRAGRPSEAAALLAAGDAELAGLPWWRRLLHTVVLRCAVVDGWGDPVPALRADLAAHEQAGDTALARTCRDLLRRAGAPAPRTRAGAVPPRLRALGVTTREAEVLALVARGMTNVAGRRAALPVPAHGRHARRQPARQDRRLDAHGAAWLGRPKLRSDTDLRAARARRPWAACPLPPDVVDHDVLVVGAGPGGLATALSAARHGARVLVVERHPGTSTRPRATGINLRTMEIFRTWGVADAVASAPSRSTSTPRPAPPWSRRRRRAAARAATRTCGRSCASARPCRWSARRTWSSRSWPTPSGGTAARSGSGPG